MSITVNAEKPFLHKLLRTLKRGKMTRAGLDSLQMYVMSLKASGEKRSDNDRVLDKITLLLQGEEIGLTADLCSELLSTLEGMRECYIQTENSLQENVRRLIQACRRNEHEIIFQLLDKHGAEIKNKNINLFLTRKSDATTTATLLAFFGPCTKPYQTGSHLVQSDNATALGVFLHFYKARLEGAVFGGIFSFLLDTCITNDSVKCFAVFKEYDYAGIPENFVYERTLRSGAYKINRYYQIEPTFGTKAAGMFVNGLEAFVKWLLKP